MIKSPKSPFYPGNAVQKGLEFGCFINDPKPKIENMRIQHRNKVQEARTAEEEGFTPAEQEKEFGFVSVAAGHGLEAMFSDLGADVVVQGGQTMNPSTDDILRAIMKTPAKTVFVLPNNKNIIMAAEQAVRLADRKVCVLQTRTIPQGISAMLAFDESLSLSDNRLNMTKAFEKVSKALIEVLELRNRLSDMQQEAIYFRGCYDSVGYLKKAGIL